MLSSFQQLFEKMPEPKAKINIRSLNEIVKKYNQEDNGELAKLLKELEFKMNFLKLCYPHILTDIVERKQATLNCADGGSKEEPQTLIKEAE